MTLEGITDEQVYKEIRSARSMFGDRRTTQDQMINLIEGLVFIVVACSEKVLPLVEATIDESNRRLPYMPL